MFQSGGSPRRVFYGWYVVYAIGLVMTTTAGLAFYNMPVLLDAFVVERGFTVSSASNATASFFLAAGFAGLLAGQLTDRFDPRYTIIAGSAIASLALLSIGVLNTPWQLFAFYIVFGFSYGLCGLVPTTTLISRWFERRRALAMSIGSTGLSLGGVVFTPIAVLLIHNLGLQGAAPWIALLFFLYGARLSPKEAWEGAQNLRLHALVLAFTYLLFPLIGFVLAPLVRPLLGDPLTAGLLFLCVLPSTVQSSIAFTSIARGNVAAALCAASASNLLGVLVTPLLLALLLHEEGVSLAGSAVPKLALQLLLPFAVGQLLRPRVASFMQRHKRLLGVVGAIRDRGTTIILVEQSVNVALTVAETAYFMEKGEIRFKGPTSELLERPDILRAVFLEGASSLEAAAAPTTNGAAERTTTTAPVILQAEGLTRSYSGVLAVNDVTFDLHQGEILGIIGPNGAGKTSLFDLLSGYLTPDRGRLFLEGTDITNLSPDRRAWLGMGRSFQDARLFPGLTVMETISLALERKVEVRDPVATALGLPVVRESERKVAARADELIELLGLQAFHSKFIRELSTGSRRIVDICCILAHDPKVILFDEPIENLIEHLIGR